MVVEKFPSWDVWGSLEGRRNQNNGRGGETKGKTETATDPRRIKKISECNRGGCALFTRKQGYATNDKVEPTPYSVRISLPSFHIILSSCMFSSSMIFLLLLTYYLCFYVIGVYL